MSIYFYLFVGGLLLIAHIFLAYFASKEIVDYPLFSYKKKIKWQLIVWLVPIIGTILTHKILGIGWASGKDSDGGDNYTCGGDGGVG